ncbi:MAG: hypothetical protein L0K86_19260, partial [Actinomycetia bacterium]|nr:hypothetical protein [Actinomycetes bacterium]
GGQRGSGRQAREPGETHPYAHRGRHGSIIRSNTDGFGRPGRLPPNGTTRSTNGAQIRSSGCPRVATTGPVPTRRRTRWGLQAVQEASERGLAGHGARYRSPPNAANISGLQLV